MRGVRGLVGVCYIAKIVLRKGAMHDRIRSKKDEGGS